MNGPVIIARRLSALAPLAAETVALLESLSDIRQAPAGSEMVADQAALRPRFLINGWGARVRFLADGRRQILSFVLPGDGLGLCERPNPIALTPVVAITPVQWVEADRIAAAAFGGDNPDLEDALHIAAALDEACLLDHVVRLGRQTALERLSHLFLELRDRLTRVDLVQDQAFAFPVTQEQLADAAGLSAVHVNRTLQSLRNDDLIEYQHGRLRLLRPALLETLADYRAPMVSGWTSARHGADGHRAPFLSGHNP
ncbi:Crp/Fnr family transcriptional regulator [Brevundimonas staleyi]|uniref:Crp/Fnr family transcriptional regulator n=1 Tax=Brevundimonas staleyi TaxID=74326 RepID=A0ABW0FT54_9CAUL